MASEYRLLLTGATPSNGFPVVLRDSYYSWPSACTPLRGVPRSQGMVRTRLGTVYWSSGQPTFYSRGHVDL